MRISSVNFILTVLFVVAISFFTTKPLYSSTGEEHQDETQLSDEQLASLTESYSSEDYNVYEEDDESEDEDEDEDKGDDEGQDDEDKE